MSNSALYVSNPLTQPPIAHLTHDNQKKSPQRAPRPSAAAPSAAAARGRRLCPAPPVAAAAATLAPLPPTSIEPLGPPPAGAAPGVAGEFSEVALWGGGKRLQTQTFDLAEDTVCIRSLDWDRDRFDIEFG